MNYILAALAGLALLAALTFGVQKWEGRIAESGKQGCYAEVAAKEVAADQVQRQEEQRRYAAQRGVEDEKQKDLTEVQNQHAVTAAAVRSLREQLAAERAKRPSSDDHAFVRERQAATALADVLGDCTERYAGMAYQADLAWNRGKSCEGKYDALISPQARAAYDRLTAKVKGATP